MSQRSFERDAQRRQDAERRRETLRRRRAGLAAGLAGAAALAAPAAAQADSFVVDSKDDTVVADGSTTLREAVTAAEQSTDPSTITFASNVRGTITLGGDPIEYDADQGGALDIQGPGASALTVSGDEDSRIFSFEGEGSVSISGLTLTKGDASNGGAIQADDVDLTLSNTTVTGNTAEYTGGGVSQSGGSLSVANSHVDSNVVDSGAKYNSGGGISSYGAALEVTGSTVDGNRVENGAGGGIAAIPNLAKFSLSEEPRGGPATDVEITDTSVSGNRAGDGGGSKFILPSDDVTITRSTFADNTATGQIYNFGIGTLARGTKGIPNWSDTDPGDGGGALIASESARVEDSTFSGNRALEPEMDLTEGPSTGPLPRGIPEPIEDGPANGVGGGLYLMSEDGLVSNSTVANNEAGTGGGIATNGAAPDDTNPPEQLPEIEALRSSTKGGPSGISTSIDNTTVAGNTATESGGGVHTDVGGFEASSTIVAGNTSETGPDVQAGNGSVDAERSLIQVPGETLESSQTNITGQAAQLGALANNGGPTKTLLPADSSPAIDQGTANELDTDQRGLRRTVDRSPANATDGTDVGSVEVAAPVQPGTTGTTPGRTGPSGRPLSPSSVPASCSRRSISLTDASVKGSKVVLKGLVGTRFYGKKVSIQTDPEGAKASAYSKTASVTAAKSDGTFTVSVPKPSKDDYPTVRYRAKIGSATSPALKLPQSLTLKSVKSAKGTITVTGRVDEDVLGKRNRVIIRRLACGRYRTMGSVRPDADGTYSLTFKSTKLRGVALYRAESSVQVRPDSKKYVKQYARAISIKTTGQTG